ncbi:MAG: hypothetical protein ABJA80_09655 [bacterium]
MSDHKVTVTFVPPDAATWSFSPRKIPVKNSSTITLVAANGSAWKFVRPNDLPSTFTWKLEGNGSKLVITDPNKPPAGEYSFTVTVAATDNKSYTSPLTGVVLDADVPPVIINDGSSK